jgi:hypothetical protein
MELHSLSELFGDVVIYRDLNPVDSRIPGFAKAYREIGLPGPTPPRKLDMSYAYALAWLLERASELYGAPPREILYVGDTMLNDGGAFANLRTYTNWPGWCFIGAEKDQELQMTKRDGLYQANRWRALIDFFREVRAQGATLGPGTVAIFDIDKTALGGRGRNDQPIDRARLAAIEATLAEALGPAFDRTEFRRAYAVVNAPERHHFTADNQDNVAYICLILSAGVIALETLLDDIAAGRMKSFSQFLAAVEDRRAEMAPAVVTLHDDVYALVRAGDLTPFKAFRRREFRETVERMGHLNEEAPLAQRLLEELCLTREVWDVAAWLKQRGCLLVALSDKPDEATSPDATLAAQGYLPLHCTRTHVLGTALEGLEP